MQHCKGIKVLFIIINAGFADEAMSLAREAGVGGATIMSARGEGMRKISLMGITVDYEKEMIICLVRDEIADKVMTAIKNNAGISTPASGVCFTMPVEKMVGISNLGKTEDEESEVSD